MYKSEKLRKNTFVGKQRFAFYTLGCKLNFSETSTIARNLVRGGFNRVNFSEMADLYIINTCSVTKKANQKCRKIIRRALRQSPNAFVVVMGCYSQLKSEEIAEIKGVDLILGTKDKFNLIEHLNSLKKKKESEIVSCDINEVSTFVPSVSTGDRTRAFLKIQDGCDYSCSYCTIPLARGFNRSDTIEHIVQIAKQIEEKGVREIVLTGVNVGDFGKSNGESFFGLIQLLDTEVGVDRIRISSIEPNLLSDDLISFVAHSNRFVPHFHIPFQSGSNRILKKMKRRYTRETYIERVETINALTPDCCIGVDILIGFPGETDEDFRRTYNIISEIDVSYLHVFTYSPRPNTEAFAMDNPVPREEKARRSRLLRNLSTSKRCQFYDRHLGQVRPVLFESSCNGIHTGLTENYIRVEARGQGSLFQEIRNVKLLSNEGKFVRGKLEY